MAGCLRVIRSPVASSACRSCMRLKATRSQLWLWRTSSGCIPNWIALSTTEHALSNHVGSRMRPWIRSATMSWMVFILMVIREPALAILVSCLFVSTPNQSIWILFYRDDHNHFLQFYWGTCCCISPYECVVLYNFVFILNQAYLGYRKKLEKRIHFDLRTGLLVVPQLYPYHQWDASPPAQILLVASVQTSQRVHWGWQHSVFASNSPAKPLQECEVCLIPIWKEVQHEECNWQTLVWQQDGHEGQVHEE